MRHGTLALLVLLAALAIAGLLGGRKRDAGVALPPGAPADTTHPSSRAVELVHPPMASAAAIEPDLPDRSELLHPSGEDETSGEARRSAGERVNRPSSSAGSVEVLVLRADGAPAAEGTEVKLAIVRVITPRDAAPFSIPSRTISAARGRTEGGRATFEGVEIGHHLSLSARLERTEGASATVTGPQRPGERLTYTLILPAEPAVLVFQALDETGEPASGMLELFLRQSSARYDDVRADRRGFFEVVLEEELIEGERRALGVAGRGRSLAARVDLDRAFPPGRTDMGVVVLHPVPIVAAGRVVDAEGRPVRGARINASPTHPREMDDGFRETLFGRDAEPTRADGAFALHGSTSTARVRLHLRHDDLRAAPLEVAVGSRGIELVAEAAGGVAGRILLDPDVSVRDLRLRLRHESGLTGTEVSTDGSGRSPSGSIDGEGRFELRGALPGVHTLTVSIDRERVDEIAVIRIAPGEIDRDPRLAPLDLRGRLRVFTLDLVPPSPSTELHGWLHYTAAGSSSRESLREFAESPVILTTPHDALDLVVCADGCRIERLTDTGERREIRLRPGLTVKLTLPHGTALPAPPLFVGATLVGDRAHMHWPTSEAFVDERGEILCQVGEPGPKKVRWTLRRREHGGSSTLRLPTEQIITVKDVDEEQIFVLDVTSADLAAALAR